MRFAGLTPPVQRALLPRTPHCIYELRDVDAGRLMAQWDGSIGRERIGCLQCRSAARTKHNLIIQPFLLSAHKTSVINGRNMASKFISVAAIESYYQHSHNAVPKLHSFVSLQVSGNTDSQQRDAPSDHRVGTSPRGLAQWRRQFGWEICYPAVGAQSDHSRMPGKAEEPDRQSLL